MLARAFIVLSFLILPALPAHAQEGAVIDNNYSNPNEGGFAIVPADCRGEDAATECGWEDLVLLIKNVIGFILYISISIAVLLFVYAGFLYLTNAGNPGRISQAKKIFTAVVVGLVIIFSAYLIISVIVTTLGVGECFDRFTDIAEGECVDDGL